MKKVRLRCLALFFIFASGLSPSAYAIEQLGPISAGVLMGPTFGNSTTIFTFGLEGTYQLKPPFAAGLSVAYYSKDFVGDGFNRSLTTLTAEGLYYFENEVPQLSGLRAGIQLGLGFSGTQSPFESGTTNFLIGPTVGYDYKLASNFSVGGESNLYFTTRSNTGAFVQLMATARYWL